MMKEPTSCNRNKCSHHSHKDYNHTSMSWCNRNHSNHSSTLGDKICVCVMNRHSHNNHHRCNNCWSHRCCHPVLLCLHRYNQNGFQQKCCCPDWILFDYWHPAEAAALVAVSARFQQVCLLWMNNKRHRNRHLKPVVMRCRRQV